MKKKSSEAKVNTSSSSSSSSSRDRARLLMIACALISRFVLARLISFASQSFFPRLGLGAVGTNLLLLVAYVISYAVPILIIVFLCPANKEEEEEEEAKGFYTSVGRDWFFVRRKRKAWQKLLGGAGALGICFLAGALGELVSSLFALIGLNLDASASASVSSSGNTGNIVFYIIYAVILAPLFEELFFRTALLRSLEKDSRATAIVASALFFALSHSPSPSSVIYAFAAGLVYAVLAFSYGSSVSFGAHFCNNLISVSLLIVGNMTGYEIPCYAVQCAVGIACAICAIVWICFGCFGCFDSLGKVKWRTLFFSPAALALAFALFAAFSPLF